MPTVKLDPNGKILTSLTESIDMDPVRGFDNTFQGAKIPSQFNRFIFKTREQLVPVLCVQAGHLAINVIDNVLDVTVRSFVEGIDGNPQRDQFLDHLLYLIPTPEIPKKYKVRSLAQLAYEHHPELVNLRDAVNNLNIATMKEDYPRTGPQIAHLAAGFAMSQLDQQYWDFLNTEPIDTTGFIEDINTLLNPGDIE